MARGDRLEEEELWGIEQRYSKQIVKTAELFMAVTNALRLKEKPFYVIGINGKKRIFCLKKVNNKEEAYQIIKEKQLERYIFADNIWNTWQAEEE